MTFWLWKMSLTQRSQTLQGRPWSVLKCIETYRKILPIWFLRICLWTFLFLHDQVWKKIENPLLDYCLCMMIQPENGIDSQGNFAFVVCAGTSSLHMSFSGQDLRGWWSSSGDIAIRWILINSTGVTIFNLTVFLPNIARGLGQDPFCCAHIFVTLKSYAL